MNTLLQPRAYLDEPAERPSCSVSTRAFRSDFLPFAFPGFLAEGKCFLRVDARAGDDGSGKYTVLCTQLRSHQGTPMSGAVESILGSLVTRLMQERNNDGLAVIEVATRFDFIKRVLHSPAARIHEVRQTARDHFRRNCLWIEHYPAGEGRFQHESWAVISFHPSGAPCWSYQTKDAVAQRLGQPEFLALDHARIETCLSSLQASQGGAELSCGEHHDRRSVA